MKRALAVCLGVAMVVCLLCANLTVTADGKTWVDFDDQLMPSYLSEYGWEAWSIDPDTPYNCATWNSWGYTQQNGAWAIRELVVPGSGTLTVEAIWGAAGYYHGGSEGDTIQFAIANGDKELVYPANGEFETIEYDEKVNPNASFTVSEGESIYFIIGNPSKANLSYYMASIIRLNGTQLQGTNGWHYGNTDGMSVQGGVSQNGAKWYYKYANSVTLTTADPNADTNMGGGEYTVNYGDTLTEMHKITATANGGSDPNNGWLGNGSYNQVPFAAGMAVYFGNKKDAHITRYTATADGDFRIGYAGIQLKASSGYKWEDGTGVDFCIVDKDGKVVYPENGGVLQLRAGTDNPFDRSKAVAFYYSNLQAGDYLDFVIIPRGDNLAANYGKYVYMAGSFTHPTSDDRIDSSGRLFLSHGEQQGSRNIKMFTASSVSVNKVADGEWDEFVKLQNALTAAPTTAEVQVKIPETVADWKVGTIISDMEGTTGNGFAVMMDTFGNPRFISGGFDWTVKNVDLRTGAWTRLTFTVDTTAGKAYCYINGVQVAETDVVGSLAVSGKAPVIGNDRAYAFTTAFEGSMKKLALATTVRLADKVTSEMTASDATHYWVLNGVYTDKAGANHGTLTQLNADWYENGKPADAADGEYTIVHIGDSQVVTDFYDDGYQEVTQWIADNAERLNIQMVINSGDLVNYAATTSQWEDAVAGMNILKDAQIPYVYALGNHEYPASGTTIRTSEEFNDHFDIVDHLLQASGKDNETKLEYAYPRIDKITSAEDLMLLENNTTGVTSYGNTYVETMENAIYTAKLGGKQYVILAFECQPRDVVVDWAKTVLTNIEAEYAAAGTEITTIVVEHDYLSSSGTLVNYCSCFNTAERNICHNPSELYTNFISQFESVELVLCGHVATGIATRTDIGANGNKIVTIMNDQSYEGNGGEGNILLLRCREDGTVIKAEYYSPILEKYYIPQYQFDFDTAADSDVAFNLPTISNMEKSNGSDRWYVSNSTVGTMQGGALVGGSLLAAYKDYAGVRTFVPSVSGTVSYKTEITYIGAGAASALEMALCKDDGTILWPTTGQWHTISDKITETVEFKATAGEKVHLILRAIDASAVTTQKYIQVKSTVTVTDEANTASTYTSTGANTGVSYTTQGTNGWYADWIRYGSNITLAPASHTVTYGVDGEGGTLSAATSGLKETDKCIVAAGGTVRFTAKPKVGYRIVGYYVNGQYYKATRRILTLPMIKEDLNVVVKFAKDKVEGDANGDGVINILDMVNMNNGIADDAAFTDKSVCDLVDNIAAADGADVIDADDIKELRRRILE
ncbi:MAG: metallophosphoesterase [Clostridia bacterium]|nr:metallophosphoesterase [Clostridia bacterium]